ncbi:hypothetical protein FRC04_011583 [Tulasnella sp. 424]|nr:hypothetical protein FRC04_011583 [Tulasnella sp. 424]KAG8964169.1 hypothetical protein FRC05_004270 [Tulasnella sp. 425]
MAPVSRIKKLRDPSFGGIRELAAFLDVLPEITHLELPSTSFRPQEGLQVQPHHAQYLEGLLCPTYVAAILVPFRPIKQLFLAWDWSSELIEMSTFDLMEAMAQSTEVIKSLGLLFGYRANMQSEIAHVFTAAAKSLPDVEELTIWVKFWKHNSPCLKSSLKELSTSLRSFRKLRTLDFNGSTGYGVSYFDHRRSAISAVYIRILQDWSQRCPTLEKVTFPNGMVWIKEPVLTHSEPSKCQPPSPPRTTLPSVPSQYIDAMLQGVEDAPGVDSLLESTPGSDSSLTQEDPMLNCTSNSEIASTANPPSPNRAAHTDPGRATSMTSYRWRCLNQYRPRSDRAPQKSQTRIQRSELGWGEPMFKRDLKGGWPEGLPTGTSR